MKNRKSNSSGMTIVEILVSVIIISLIMGLLFSLLIQVQKANTESKTKSSLLIAQNVVTKAIEKDMIEVGIKAVSKCSYTDFFPTLGVDETKEHSCVRIEYNQTYDMSDVGYILVYKQNNEVDNPAWVMRYGKGYYNNCGVNSSPTINNSWVETYSVVQKIDENIELELSSANINVRYSALYEENKKYSEQKGNSGNLTIPIKDQNGFSYDIDTTFVFRLNYPSNPTESNPEYSFTCDDSSFGCGCTGGYCDRTKASKNGKLDTNNKYIYLCSEEKASEGSVIGMNKNFIDSQEVTSAKIYPDKIRSVSFLSTDNFTNDGSFSKIDISYSKNGTTYLYYKPSDVNPSLFDTYIVQDGVVTIYNNSMASMFKNFTKLEEVDFKDISVSGVTNFSYLFYGCESLNTLKNFDKLDFATATDFSYMFYNCKNIKVSPFRGRTDLTKLSYATSLFSDSGLGLAEDDDEFIYTRDLPAYNVKTLRNFVKGTSIKKFVLDLEGGTLPYLTTLNELAGGCRSVTEAYISNVNLPATTNLSFVFENDVALLKAYITNVSAPNATTLSGFFQMNMSLQDFKFENVDFHNVKDFSYMFYATRAISNINPIVDLTSLDFHNATYFNAMFTGTGAQYIKFAEEDDDSFTLDSVTQLQFFLQSCSAFKGFAGKKPKFRNVTTMENFMSYSRALGHVDLSDLELNNCKRFNMAFQDTRYTSIDISGIHSKVTADKPSDISISLYYMFYSNPNLNYAYLNDAEFKVGVDAMGLFLNCPMLTFVKDLDFTKNEDLDVYFSGGGTMVYNNGKSPFENLFVAPGVVRRVNDMFKQDALLRGFPDGYLNGLRMTRDYTYSFSGMFEGAFNTSISAAIQLTEEEYKKIYQVDLGFEQPAQFIQKNVFKDCTNLAVIKFSNSTKLCYNYADSNVGNISVISNLGKAAFESGRISSFDFYFNDTEFYDWGCNATKDHIKYFFRNNNFNEYVINGETGKAKANIHLSNDCTIAKRQISKFKTGAYDAFGEENVTFVGPDGCNLG